MLGYVYKIVNSINNKVYIGKTFNPKKRWSGHRDAVRYIKDNRKIVSAMRKYGFYCFNMVIIATVLDYEKDADYLEKLIISEYDSYTNGYNSTKGGESSPLGVRSHRTDYTGKVFTYLTIIGDAEDALSLSGNKSRRVVCRCICGAEKEFNLSNIVQGRVTSCGCSRPQAYNRVDHVGIRYGRLVVIDNNDTKNRTKVLCKCDCGVTKLVDISAMVSGNISTCGCKVGFNERKFTAKGIEFVKISEAALYFSVNQQTIRRWLQKGTNEAAYLQPKRNTRHPRTDNV